MQTNQPSSSSNDSSSSEETRKEQSSCKIEKYSGGSFGANHNNGVKVVHTPSFQDKDEKVEPIDLQEEDSLPRNIKFWAIINVYKRLIRLINFKCYE